jgi:hypothetical protein
MIRLHHGGLRFSGALRLAAATRGVREQFVQCGERLGALQQVHRTDWHFPAPQEVTVQARQIVVAAAALVALAGCGSKAADQRTGSAAPAASASAAPSASVDAGTLDATSAYLTALGKLDGALVTDQRAALDRGAETCLDIADKKPENEQERNVASRFAVDAAQAKEILAVTKSNLCLG